MKILIEIMEEKLASKQDLQELESRLQNTIATLHSDIQHSVAQLESKLTIRMGTMLATSIAVLTAIQKLV